MSSETRVRAAQLAPAALSPSLPKRVWRLLLLVLAAAAVVQMGRDLDLAPGALMKGTDKLALFLGAMVPPTSGGMLVRIVKALGETFAMAFAGTVLAAVTALPLGVVGAKTIVRNPVAHFVFRRFLDLFRGVPALVWALILVSAFGLGPFAGVVALALADIPHLAKLFAEAIENCDPKPAEGVRAAGAPPLAVMRYSLAPQVTPVIASQCLFFLEGNFRSAAVLGIVGAGGIGFELEERIRIFAFDQAAFIILLYMAGVATLDLISRELRKRLA
ncbi:phosphonate ABC transporter, permease protein PhnE [Phenylobacterium sp.]|uniref:phosphonate ABC transporter, permease protein PhnE n=1 Tax=Phenylobacterium sp. TaxID=1871053 RepID=UPI0035B0D805